MKIAIINKLSSNLIPIGVSTTCVILPMDVQRVESIIVDNGIVTKASKNKYRSDLLTICIF